MHLEKMKIKINKNLACSADIPSENGHDLRPYERET
jgi:hypothetical protein